MNSLSHRRKNRRTN